jgi:hypothetical protein
VNRTQRIGTLCFLAKSTHLPLTSESGLVLSVERSISHGVIRRIIYGYVPTATDFPSSKYCPATLMHFSRFRTSVGSHGVLHQGSTTHCSQSILIDSLKSERLELFPVKRGLASTRAAAEEDNFLAIFLEVDFRCYAAISSETLDCHTVFQAHLQPQRNRGGILRG